MKRISFLFALTILALLACSGEPDPDSPEYTRYKITQALDSLAVNPHSSFNDTLAKLPDDSVNIALLAALESRQDLTDDSRLALYEQLRLHNAATMPAGVYRLLLGLRDTLPVALTSLKALKAAPELSRRPVVKGLDTLLTDTTIPDPFRADMITQMMLWHALDSTHIGRLSAVFADTTRSPNLRKSAFAGLLAPAGPGYCLNLLNKPDPVGLKVALDVLAGTVGLTVGTVGTDDDRKRMKQLCLESLFHADKDARLAAVAALQGIFGKEYNLTVNNRQTINPEIMRALERMSQVEPDSTLRVQIRRNVSQLR